eukprot:6694503-Heterocapsa_arctica.AAC.1
MAPSSRRRSIPWSSPRSTEATRSKECAGYSWPETTTPSMEEMNKLIVEGVVQKTMRDITPPPPVGDGREWGALPGDR